MTWTQFAKNQYTALPLVVTRESCAGKTFIVTGANTGLGYEAAKHLVALSPKNVIIAVRSLQKGEDAKARIENETGNKGIAQVWQLDLASKESTIKFAERVKTLERVDAIIMNASVALMEYTVTEGLETTVTVNLVNTFLLAVLVLPKLEESGKKFKNEPHMAIVGSGAAFRAEGVLEKIPAGDILNNLKADTMRTRYPTSKLLQFYALRQFCDIYPQSKTGVTINFVNPGFCNTELTRNAPLLMSIMFGAYKMVMARTAEKGSRTLLHGAVVGPESHGTYVSECQIKQDYIPEWITNAEGKEIQQRVWDSLTKKLNAIKPGCI